jgi:hypothetical protein
MKVKAIAYTPVGTFESNIETASPAAVTELLKSFEKPEKITHLALKNGDQTIYLPAEVIKHTVFVLEVTQEDGEGSEQPK